MQKPLQSFEEFWEYYVMEHSLPHTRQLHFMGSTAAVTLAVTGLFAGRFSFVVLAVLVGYGIAWISHFVVQKNKPASWEHPMWSFLSDAKLFFLMATGRMDEEVERVMGRHGQP